MRRVWRGEALVMVMVMLVSAAHASHLKPYRIGHTTLSFGEWRVGVSERGAVATRLSPFALAPDVCAAGIY